MLLLVCGHCQTVHVPFSLLFKHTESDHIEYAATWKLNVVLRSNYMYNVQFDKFNIIFLWCYTTVSKEKSCTLLEITYFGAKIFNLFQYSIFFYKYMYKYVSKTKKLIILYYIYRSFYVLSYFILCKYIYWTEILLFNLKNKKFWKYISSYFYFNRFLISNKWVWVVLYFQPMSQLCILCLFPSTMNTMCNIETLAVNYFK